MYNRFNRVLIDPGQRLLTSFALRNSMYQYVIEIVTNERITPSRPRAMYN